MTDSFANLAPHLIGNGYDRVIPLRKGGKAPRYKVWESANTEAPSPEAVSRWIERGRYDGVGLAAGGAVFGLDLDQKDPLHAAAVSEIADEVIGPSPIIRIGQAPKTLRLYRQLTPLRSRTYRDIDIGFYGTTGQFVLFAIHPETREPYHYPVQSPLDVKASDLPPVDEASAQRFVAEVRGVLPSNTIDTGAGYFGVAADAQEYFETYRHAHPDAKLGDAMVAMMSETSQRHPTMTGIVAFLCQCGWSEREIIDLIAEPYLSHFTDNPREVVCRYRKLECSIKGAERKGIANDPGVLVTSGFLKWGRCRL